MTHLPKSASPSEPRTQQDAPIEHGCNAPSPEGIADRDRASNSTSAERDEREALEQVCKLITEFDISEGKQHRRNLAIDALYRWRNVTEKYLAARACASPLPQTPDKYRALMDIAGRILEECQDGEWGGIEWDGADCEELLTKAGLIEQKDVTEACGENCVCEGYGFPGKCNRTTALGADAIKGAAPAQPVPPKVYGSCETLGAGHNLPHGQNIACTNWEKNPSAPAPVLTPADYLDIVRQPPLNKPPDAVLTQPNAEQKQPDSQVRHELKMIEEWVRGTQDFHTAALRQYLEAQAIPGADCLSSYNLAGAIQEYLHRPAAANDSEMASEAGRPVLPVPPSADALIDYILREAENTSRSISPRMQDIITAIYMYQRERASSPAAAPASDVHKLAEEILQLIGTRYLTSKELFIITEEIMRVSYLSEFLSKHLVVPAIVPADTPVCAKCKTRLKYLDNEIEPCVNCCGAVVSTNWEENAEISELKLENARLRGAASEELGALKLKHAKLVKAVGEAECLPECDEYFHEEKCPNASTAMRLVELTEKLAVAGRTLGDNRKLAIEILSNCSGQYFHPAFWDAANPQKIIDMAIDKAEEIIGAALRESASESPSNEAPRKPTNAELEAAKIKLHGLWCYDNSGDFTQWLAEKAIELFAMRGASPGREGDSLTANDFLNHQLAKTSTDRHNKFGGFNTWTLGMVKLMLEFAEAYQRQCAIDARKADDSSRGNEVGRIES